jgi:hypothetical protein
VTSFPDVLITSCLMFKPEMLRGVIVSRGIRGSWRPSEGIRRRWERPACRDADTIPLTWNKLMTSFKAVLFNFRNAYRSMETLGRFQQHFTSSYYKQRSQKCKKDWRLDCIFLRFLGNFRIKKFHFWVRFSLLNFVREKCIWNETEAMPTSPWFFV